MAEAVAFAVPDAKYGEVVGAVVVATPGADEATLAAHCGEWLSAFRGPARIVSVDEIPKGPTGKIQRRLLAQQVAG